MKKSKRLQQVSKIAEHDEDEAGRKMAHQRKVSDQQNQQLKQLQDYRAEYARQFEKLGSEGASARQLNDFRTFLTKLNGAIEQQKNSVDNAQQQLDTSHRQWLETRQRVQALGKAVDRQRAQEQFEQDKKEQAESDEQAMRSGADPFGS